MKSAYFAFLKSPIVIIGMVTAVIFQIFFSVIWLTGYDHITDRTDQFKIVIVNQDPVLGAKIAQSLSSLKFQMQQDDNLNDAMTLLNERKVHMVVRIPADFSQSLQDPAKKATVTYSINESTPTMVKSVMQIVEDKVTAALNEQSIQSGMQAALMQMRVPQQQASGMSQALSQRVVAEINNINPVSNFSRIMVPNMLVLASFTGAMLFALELNKAAKALKGRFSRWQMLGARFALNVTTALIVSTVGSLMVNEMGVYSERGFTAMWLFQIVYVLTFIFVAQLPFFFLSDAGGWFNIAMLSTQLLSSGATIPREMLSNFYRSLSDYLPATFAVDGIMNLVTGGPGLHDEIASLLRIFVVAVLIMVVMVGIRRERAVQLVEAAA